MVRMRLAKVEDDSAISEINVRGWQFAFRELLPGDFLDSLNPRDRDSAFAERVTAGPPHHTAVAVDGDEIVGFVGLEPPDGDDLDPSRVHEIWGLYIEPQRFGTGLGRILLDHAMDRLQAGHERLKRVLTKSPHPWILTYDAHDRTRELYRHFRCLRFGISHTAQVQKVGREFMFFSRGLRVPDRHVMRDEAMWVPAQDK